ncbi:hypothetical protein KR093_010909 [Drosophila rubida]|uniref:Uncharacterized protein n=1 Tax=Drosophila rubida TaxID=30044 RepID=A0AAD4K8J7_9MUSC|nr:hypothetical protein KR093_010909 [Drosophila rubida]
MFNANEEMANAAKAARNEEGLRQLMDAMYNDVPAEVNAESNQRPGMTATPLRLPRHPVFAGRYVTKVEHASPLVVSKRFVKPQMICVDNQNNRDSQPERLLRKLFCVYALRKVVLLITPKATNSQISDMYNIHAYMIENRWHLGVTSLTTAERDLFVHNQKPNNYALIFCNGYIQLEDAFMNAPLKNDIFAVLEQKSNAGVEIKYRGKRFTLHYSGAEIKATDAISKPITTAEVEDDKNTAAAAAASREAKISARNTTAEIRPLQLQNMANSWQLSPSTSVLRIIENAPLNYLPDDSGEEREEDVQEFLDMLDRQLEEEPTSDVCEDDVDLEEVHRRLQSFHRQPREQPPLLPLRSAFHEPSEESLELDINEMDEQNDASPEPAIQEETEQVAPLSERRLSVNEELIEDEPSNANLGQVEEQQQLLAEALQTPVDSPQTANSPEQLSKAVMELRQELQDFAEKSQSDQRATGVDGISPEMLKQTKKELIKQAFKGQAYMAKSTVQQAKELETKMPLVPPDFNKVHREKLEQLKAHLQLQKSLQNPMTSGRTDMKQSRVVKPCEKPPLQQGNDTLEQFVEPTEPHSNTVDQLPQEKPDNAALEQMAELPKPVHSNCSIGQLQEPSIQDTQHEIEKPQESALQQTIANAQMTSLSEERSIELQEELQNTTQFEQQLNAHKQVLQQDHLEEAQPEEAQVLQAPIDNEEPSGANKLLHTQSEPRSLKAIALSQNMLKEAKKALIRDSFKGQAYMAKKTAQLAKEVPVKKPPVPQTFNKAHKEKLLQLQLRRQLEKSFQNQAAEEKAEKQKLAKQIRAAQRPLLQQINDNLNKLGQVESSNATSTQMEEPPEQAIINYSIGKLETSSKGDS